MMLNALRQKYEDNEPIYLEDVLSSLGVSSSYGRTLVSKWVKEGRLRRFDRGIYYFPKKSKIFGEAAFESQRVIEDKYLGSKDAPFGYYADFTLANIAGLTTQIPAKTTIITNAEKSDRRREITLGSRKIIVSRPKKNITKENVSALSLLDLISTANKYSELSPGETVKMIQRYAVNAKISWKQIRDNIDAYPTRVSRELIRMELYNVLT